MHPSRQTGRAGFTLLELVVVLAIIGILLGLLLCAVQKVRARAGGAECANNLRQLALAANNGLSEHGTFPPPFYFWPQGGPPAPMAGPLWQLLPYLDQTTLYKSRPVTADAAAPRLKLFQCPTDPTISSAPTTSYLLNGNLFDGVTRVNQISDGLSNTALCTETYANCDGTNPVYWSNSGSATLLVYAPEGEAVFRSSPRSSVGSTNGCSVTIGDNAQSAHAGGILVAMADGSVRTVSLGGASQQASTGIKGTVTNWVAAFTHNSGEVIGSEW